MKTIPFDIRYRADIESGKVKVVTGKEKPVSILRWDMVGSHPILGCTMVERCNWEGDESWEEERPIAFNNEGHAEGYAPADKMDLFLLVEEPPMTAFEKELNDMLDYAMQHAKPDVNIVEIFKERIFDAARLEIIKNLPHWKKCENPLPNNPGIFRYHVGCYEYNGYEINLDEVFKKLPKEENV